MKEATLARARQAFSNDFYNSLDKACANCDTDLIPNDVVAINGASVICLSCYLTATANLREIRSFSKFLKVAIGCEACGYARHAFALQYDHINASEKYRTKSGKLVHPSDLFATCSAFVFVAEVAKCVIRCANCHAEKTAKERGL